MSDLSINVFRVDQYEQCCPSVVSVLSQCCLSINKCSLLSLAVRPSLSSPAHLVVEEENVIVLLMDSGQFET